MKQWLWGFLFLLFYSGCGGQSSSPPLPAQPQPTVLGYVVNTKSNSVMSFGLDERTGTLSAGNTLGTGTLPGSSVVTPDGQFLFVSNAGDGTISRFYLDGKGGIQSAGSAIPLNNPSAKPWDLAIAPSGKFLYVGTSPNAVEAFRVDTQTGDLEALANSPFPVTSQGAILALSHSGQFLYTTWNDTDAISIFSVDTLTGALTPLSTGAVHTGFTLKGLAVDPTDKYLFVTTDTSEKLLVYNIQASGNLEESPSSRLQSGYMTQGPVFAPNGRFVYVADPFFDNGILAYVLNPVTGAVTPVASSPFHDGQTPSSVAVSPSSKFLVVSRINPGHLALYSIDPQSGALASISGPGSESGLPTGNSPNDVVLLPRKSSEP